MRISVDLAAFSLAAAGLLGLMQAQPTTKTKEFANKIAFTRNGEIWVADENGQNRIQITNTGRKVEAFLFSPNLEYLAYSRIIRYVDEPGLFQEGEPVPKRTLCSIVVYSLHSQRTVKEILPKENWIYPATWLPGNRLLFYESSAFDVAGFSEFDAVKLVTRGLDYHKAIQLWDADFSNDGTSMLYVDDSGLGGEFKMRLHLVNLKTNSEQILFSHKTIYSARMSGDNQIIAFVDVEQLKGSSFDSLWTYNIQAGIRRKLLTMPAKPKVGGEDLVSWSPDNRRIALFFTSKALVVEVQNPENQHKISGSHFGWLDQQKIIFAEGNTVRAYNLLTHGREILLQDASKPRFLSIR